jgi:DNA polymerase III subunit gamma/tau
MTDTQNLNLARKWRSKNFEQIVGQELSVRMLKNSLYLNHYFPVYLFAGQRGCGKTSTARVFAAAINCQELSNFQKNPQATLLPCMVCISCHAYAQGNHPDFIEIDAASNTGVDNVRQIIDSSSLLPLMGSKKIYLIDEAHMLSKAAFNAFLKLMEEPPATVILATTDTQKIIETVRSRCFQLFFKPVDALALQKHLAYICSQENIDFQEDGLALIVQETDGSARDAINLLEQVRFSADTITRDTVCTVLGYLDESRLLKLLEIILYKGVQELLQFCHENKLEQFSSEFLWSRITNLLRACIWIKNGVTPDYVRDYASQLQFLARGKSLSYITNLLELLYAHEPLFKKITGQYAFLEVILLRICQKNEGNSNSNMPASSAASQPCLSQEDEEIDTQEEDDETDTPAYEEKGNVWGPFVQSIEQLKDPLLSSIFKQATIVACDHTVGSLHIDFPKGFTFFADVIDSSKAQWEPLLEQAMNKKVSLQVSFTRNATMPDTAAKTVEPVIIKKVEQAPAGPAPVKKFNTYANSGNGFTKKIVSQPLREPRVDVSDTAMWPHAHILLQHFPGTVTQVKEIV